MHCGTRSKPRIGSCGAHVTGTQYSVLYSPDHCRLYSVVVTGGRSDGRPAPGAARAIPIEIGHFKFGTRPTRFLKISPNTISMLKNLTFKTLSGSRKVISSKAWFSINWLNRFYSSVVKNFSPCPVLWSDRWTTLVGPVRLHAYNYHHPSLDLANYRYSFDAYLRYQKCIVWNLRNERTTERSGWMIWCVSF